MISKKTFTILLLILLNNILSCKQNSDKRLSDIPEKEKGAINTHKLTCQEIVEKIVKSSDLNLKDYKNYFIDIDKIESDSISIHVYFENNLSDDPEQKQIVESTIAWLLLIPSEQILYNVTVDPEKPVALKFDKHLLAQNDIFRACEISEKNIPLKGDINDKAAILPFNFEDFYAVCVYPSDEKKCSENYPKYDYNEKSELFKIIGSEFYFSEYIYLPAINDFKPVILCDNTSDIEKYYLIVIKDGRIISNLLIGKMDGEGIQDFNILKNYNITLFKRKNRKDARKETGKYKISNDGTIIKL